MDLVQNITLDRYTEEVSLLQSGRPSFIRAAEEAALSLNWLILELTEHYMVCQTPFSANSRGELVRISVLEDKALIEVTPVNEYYCDGMQLRNVAAAFNSAVAPIEAEAGEYERSKHPMHREKYGALIPSKTYQVTPFLVYSIALVFVIMVLAGVAPLDPSANSLLEWGGNFKNAVLNGQSWRLLSYMFLHAGAMHLLMNTFALLYIGLFLEPLVGGLRLLAAYLITGICAGFFSILIHPFSVGVGASGAIFGLYGVFFSLLTTRYLQKTAKKTMLRGLLFFIVFNLLMGLQGNTDNAAHIGGLISGILVGYSYYPGIKHKAPVRMQVATITLIAGVLLGLGVLLKNSFM